MANDSIRNAPARNTPAPPRTEAIEAKKIAGGLEVGARGPEVKELQRVLNEKGCKDADGKPLKTDSVFGPKTEAAVKAFQEQNGCAPTGVVDPPTLAKLQGAEAKAEAPAVPTDPAQPKASKETVEGSRTKMRSREELMRARVEGADKAVAKGEKYDVVNDSTVQAAADGIGAIKGSITEQKASILAARQGIRKEIFDLQSKKERTEPEEMLLTGKKAQEEVLAQMDKHLSTKNEVMDAALGAVSDGIISEGENKGLGDATKVMAEAEKILAMKAKAADQVVATAEKLIGKVKPEATLSKEQVDAAVNEVARGVGGDKSKIDSASKIFGALDGKTPAQVKQIENAYNEKFGKEGWSFEGNVRGKMHTWNKEAFDALSAGKTDDFRRLRAEGAVKDQEVNAGTRKAVFDEAKIETAVKNGPKRGLQKPEPKPELDVKPDNVAKS